MIILNLLRGPDGTDLSVIPLGTKWGKKCLAFSWDWKLISAWQCFSTAIGVGNDKKICKIQIKAKWLKLFTPLRSFFFFFLPILFLWLAQISSYHLTLVNWFYWSWHENKITVALTFRHDHATYLFISKSCLHWGSFFVKEKCPSKKKKKYIWIEQNTFQVEMEHKHRCRCYQPGPLPQNCETNWNWE